MKYILILCSATALLILMLMHRLHAQSTVTGRVYRAEDGKPFTGATLRLLGDGRTTRSGADGTFSLHFTGQDTLLVSHVGYIPERVPVKPGMQPLDVFLDPAANELEEVQVNTGYYRVPKERATGSFVQIDNKLLNRAVGHNILQRLEGVAPGVQFVNAGGTSAGDIRVRGLTTIESDETPLIVLDNFPYEGSLDNIDPNSIESITVLKDAAAASIWGARAGNGVIVITTRQAAKDGQIRIALNANANVTAKPDLFYSPSWLPSATVMEIEKERYRLGHYKFEDRTAVPLYIEWLRSREEGRITDAELAAQEDILRRSDVRRQAMDHLYRSSGFQQYALNVSGGAARYGYDLSAGYHRGRGRLVGDDSERLNLSMRNRFIPFEGTEVVAAVAYVGQRASSNGMGLNSLGTPGFGLSPYLRLTDERGNALPIPRDIRYDYAASAATNGLLDWLYRPVDELTLADHTSRSNELRINGDLNTRVWKGLTAKASYQYVRGNSGSQSHYSRESYYVRSLVNQFTQPGGERVIPYEGIWQTGNPIERFSHFGRAQLNFDRNFGTAHHVALLGGAEMRHSESELLPATVLYNYSDTYLTGSNQFNFNERYSTLPAGSPARLIPNGSELHRQYVNRDLSYFGNASYTLRQRYVASASVRWDGSNLFGVKTNQKGVPLWSVGGSWELSREDFYPLSGWLPYARIRATYGVAGNVNKTVTHYPTVRFGTSPIGLSAGQLVSVGNPSLKWERVSTSNLGLDWSAFHRRISGSVEAYLKKGGDLIGDSYMDPTTGIADNYKINYADIETRGLDLQLNAQAIKGGINWNIRVLAGWVRNKVTDYNRDRDLGISYYLVPSSARPYEVGQSRDVVYAIPWLGLSSSDGYPLIFMEGAESTDYATYYNTYLDESKLVKSGVSVPTFYGSMRNTVSWKGIDAGFMFSWKGNYVFRRASMAPGGEFSQQYHEDYFRRWELPGDELHTDVPAYIAPERMDRQANAVASIYTYSEALITRGDHVRLQEINIGYALPPSLVRRVPLQGIRVYGYARDLGTVWMANRVGIDPDYANALFVAPPSYSFGIQLTW